jgi:hypothetical protein
LWFGVGCTSLFAMKGSFSFVSKKMKRIQYTPGPGNRAEPARASPGKEQLVDLEGEMIENKENSKKKFKNKLRFAPQSGHGCAQRHWVKANNYGTEGNWAIGNGELR